MHKPIFGKLLLVVASMTIIMGAAPMLMIVNHCAPVVSMCDQNVIISAYATIIVAAIAVAAAAIVEASLYSRQARQNDEYHKEQMDAMKRLETR